MQSVGEEPEHGGSLSEVSPITQLLADRLKVVPRSSDKRTWPCAVVAIVAVLATLVILRETLSAMVDVWYRSNTFAHCFLILPIAFWLGWIRRNDLVHATAGPDWRGGVLVLVGSLGWLIGAAADAQVLQQLSLVALVQAIVWATCGAAVFRVLLFPLLYLYFAVPVGTVLIPPLQDVTAALAVGLVKSVGIPVFSDGYLISVPSGDFYVAEACSGIRYLIASMCLGVLCAGMMDVGWWRRLLIVLVSVAIPILANGLRAFGIIVLAYASNNQLAQGIDHLVYGWIFFSLTSLLTLVIANGIARFRASDEAPRQKHAIARREALPASQFTLALALATVLIPVASAKLYAGTINNEPTRRAAGILAPDIPGYQKILGETHDPYAPQFAGPDQVVDATYQQGQQIVHLYLGYYSTQRSGAQAVSSVHQLAGSAGAPIAEIHNVEATVAETATSIESRRTSVGNGGRVIWNWYWVDGRVTGSPYLAKLLGAKAKLTGEPTAAAIIVIAVDYEGSDSDAKAAMREFALKAQPVIATLQDATRG